MPNNKDNYYPLGNLNLISALVGSFMLGIAISIGFKSIPAGILATCGVFCSLFSIVVSIDWAVCSIEACLDKKLSKPSES